MDPCVYAQTECLPNFDVCDLVTEDNLWDRLSLVCQNSKIITNLSYKLNPGHLGILGLKLFYI